MRIISMIAIALLQGYQRLISPGLVSIFGPMGFGCRFTPTCSEYAIEAVRAHGSIRGSGLAARRLCRCHPWGGCGEDPVPPAAGFSAASIQPQSFLKSLL